MGVIFWKRWILLFGGWWPLLASEWFHSATGRCNRLEIHCGELSDEKVKNLFLAAKVSAHRHWPHKMKKEKISWNYFRFGLTWRNKNTCEWQPGQINLICNTRSGWHSVVKFEALYEQESRARLWGGVQPPRAALSKLCQLRYKLLRGTPALLPLVKSTHTHTNSFRYTQFQFLENIRFDVFGRDCKFSILYQTQILPNDQRSAISQLHQICNLSGRHWQLLNSVFRFWVSHLQHL